VVVSDGSVSRKHARLERRATGWSVTDQGSANGTFLDSQRVAESALRAGQELRFGAVGFRVEIEDDDISATVMATISPEATVVASPQMMPTPPLGVPSASSVSGVPNPPPKAPEAPSRPVPPPPAPPPLPRSAPPPLPASSKTPSAAAAKERFGGPGASAGAPSAPVGQMAPPPVAGKKGKSPLFWILSGCCGCLLLCVLLAAGIGGAAFFATQAPAAAVQAQLADLRKGDLEAAYGRLSPELQARLSREDFAQMVAEHPGLRENKDATFWNRSVQNDTAKLSGLVTSRSGEREAAVFELRLEGGVWRITGINVGGGSE
jgi:hypothetical protein